MDQPISRFTIDDYLKRYRKALGYLPLCGPKKTFDDVLGYIRKHELYKEGMRIYKDKREKYDVTSCYCEMC